MANETELYKMFALLLVIIAVAVYVLWNLPGRWIESNDGDFKQTFLYHVGQQDAWSFAMKETMSRILTAWWDKQCSCILVTGPGVDECHIIELVKGPMGPGKVDKIPMIKAKWYRAANENHAKSVARRFFRSETITCTEETFAQFSNHLALCPVTDQTLLPNGHRTFHGYLSPVPR